VSDFPRLLYRVPGPHNCGGVMADYRVVDDAEQEAGAVGWYRTPWDAQDAASAPASTSAPTRAELEQKATELGLRFDKRTGDALLASRIAEALKRGD
jgi:hypothetical protein